MKSSPPSAKKKKSLKRDLIEWAIIVGLIAILYVTGWYSVVMGNIQSLVLKTGILRPKIQTDRVYGSTDYNFRLIDQNGNVIEGPSLKGKVVFLNFWATWCPPCIAEMPDINRLYKSVNHDKITFLMVSVNDNFDKARQFAKKRGFSFNIYKPIGGIPAVFAGNVVPTTYIITPAGNIVMKREGMAEYNTKSFRDFLKTIEKE